ncbi:MAG: hypothetical protein ACYSW2_17105 [Planctomycetota bacterium]|jgi:hypothetical protein
MSTRSIALAFAVGAAAVPCSGQSINIDFGDGNGGPPADYAAAGLPGTWNVLTAPPDTATPLVGLDGAPLPAMIRATNGFGPVADMPIPHPELGGDRWLLDDGLLGMHGPEIPIEVEFFGLEHGLYRLITYTWYWPAEAYAQAVFVDGSPFQHPAGGPWGGALTLGVSHMEHLVQVTQGALLVPASLTFHVVGDGPGAFYNGDILLNGIQLWKIDEPIPCPADIDGNLSVGINDFLLMLAVWGQCSDPPTPCPADVDGDGTVGIIDFLLLLAAWGPCPGTDPATCGEPGLGDCYSAHGSPGCDEAHCCEAVCSFDPYCCDVAWDQLCVGLANLAADCTDGVHPHCGNPEAGSCVEQRASPGCDDPECCQVVCDIDSFCCNYAWDLVCVAEAELFCSEIPPACGHPAAGDCFDAIGPDQNFTPYCDDEDCCNAVCQIDAYCCSVLWDAGCVARANAICEGGACGDGAGDCFTPHPTGGCDNADCCYQVCSVVPACCEDSDGGLGGWNENCVAWAELLCGE